MLIVTVTGYTLYPVNTPYKFTVFAGITMAAGFMVMVNIRKHAKLAKCPSCQVDLYEVTEAARLKGIKTKYCLACGGSLEV